jgi:hypothetical protein
MKSADQFREYANECLEWAQTAETEAERSLLLQLTTTWTRAATIAKQLADDLDPPEQDAGAAVWVFRSPPQTKRKEPA